MNRCRLSLQGCNSRYSEACIVRHSVLHFAVLLQHLKIAFYHWLAHQIFCIMLPTPHAHFVDSAALSCYTLSHCCPSILGHHVCPIGLGKECILANADLASNSPAKTSPGMMALQLIPFLAYSRAATLTRYSMPAFPCREASSPYKHDARKLDGPVMSAHSRTHFRIRQAGRTSEK